MRIPQASEFFIIGIEGPELNTAEQELIHSSSLGGIILFKRNIVSIEQVVALNTTIIETASHYVPLISVDQEGGRVARLKGLCTDIPALSDLLADFSADEHLCYRLGAMQGRELAALGFNLNFAPVCDLFVNDKQHVIGDRAFSSCPSTAAQLAKLYIKGLQGAGIAACAKHFPGHGATLVDSHLALPVLDTDYATLHQRELVPFRSAIDADVATIMTAHIINKPLDMVPATMSEKTLRHLLRAELGYKNIIISDDLDMKAVADHYSLQETIEQSLLASVDLFIIGNNFAKTLEAIAITQKLIDSYDIFKQKAKEATARIDAMRNRYLGKPKVPDLKDAQSIVRSRPHLELLSASR